MRSDGYVGAIVTSGEASALEAYLVTVGLRVAFEEQPS